MYHYQHYSFFFHNTKKKIPSFIHLIFWHLGYVHIYHTTSIVIFSRKKMGRTNLYPIQFVQSFLSSIIIMARISHCINGDVGSWEDNHVLLTSSRHPFFSKYTAMCRRLVFYINYNISLLSNLLSEKPGFSQVLRKVS